MYNIPRDEPIKCLKCGSDLSSFVYLPQKAKVKVFKFENRIWIGSFTAHPSLIHKHLTSSELAFLKLGDYQEVLKCLTCP